MSENDVRMAVWEALDQAETHEDLVKRLLPLAMQDAPEGTPQIKQEIRNMLEGWQDSQVYVNLNGIMQACLLSTALMLGNGNLERPDPDVLRHEAVDIRVAADGVAQFIEHLADRIEAKENGGE